MNILVLNGSPKGKASVTLQTIHYLELLFPEQSFEILHVGQRIKALEKDFSPALDAIKKADLLLFTYPVYTFLAPCQLHRFIELLKTAGVDLTGKYASQLTTSKHFYDITAHRYIQDNCDDLGLRYIRGLSADMDDLTCKKGQKEAADYFRYLCWSVEQGIYEPKQNAPYQAVHQAVTVPADTDSCKSGDVVIVADIQKNDTQLQNMIDCFRSRFTRKTRIVNIREYPFRGGCLGCFNCAASGKCIYTDGFDDYLRNEIQTAEAIFTLSPSVITPWVHSLKCTTTGNSATDTGP